MTPFTDKDLIRLKAEMILNQAEGSTLATDLVGLIARLEAAERYREAHPCTHREPHGATDVGQIGCQYDLEWRKAAGK